jgi:thiol-disulfide isomerase/thioredoxin
VDDDGAIVTSMYGLHLYHYVVYHYSVPDTLVQRLLKEKRKADANRRVLDHVIENEKPGLSRDIMCFRWLDALFEESFDDFQILWPEIERYGSSEKLISLMREKKEHHEKLKDFNISVFVPSSEQEKEITGDFWTNLQERYHGKVIYLDLWATYCGPCLGEIPEANALHGYFKDQPVVFINLCLSSEKTAWRRLIKNMHISGENYFFDKEQSRLFLGKLKGFQGFPTYMIIDRSGNIVDSHAPPPSSGEEIRQRLERLME